MAVERRKDNKNRVLKEGEYQRSSGTYCIIPDLEGTAERMNRTEFTIRRYEAIQDPIAMVGETFVMVMSYDKDVKDFFRMKPTIRYEDASGRKYKQTFHIDISDRLGNGTIINYAQPELCEE